MKEGPKELDVLFWLNRTALELIGQGGLGYSFDPLTEDVPNEYADAVKTFQSVLFLALERNVLLTALCYREIIFPLFQVRMPIIFKFGSAWFRRRVVELIPLNIAQRARMISDTIDRCSRQVFREKRLALQEGDEAVRRQVGEGKDIMSRLREYFSVRLMTIIAVRFLIEN